MVRRHLTHILWVALSLVLLTAPAVSAKLIAVPEGNRNESQPAVPGASVKRTKQTKSSFDRKYEKVHENGATCATGSEHHGIVPA